MKNLLCPDCNAKLKFSKLCKCSSCSKCKLYYFCSICCSDNGFCLALQDSFDFHIRYYEVDKNAVIYYLENPYYKNISIENIIITNHIEAYKILIKYKTNMVFL